jgi:cyclophilin family peptidyl-prolyl cis-trans isomerase
LKLTLDFSQNVRAIKRAPLKLQSTQETIMLNQINRRFACLLLSMLFACGTALAAGEATAPQVRLKTSMGDIVVELDAAKAPNTVENFLGYVKAGHYAGTIFHRVINGFMIQGGGFNAKMTEKPVKAPIKIESQNGLSNLRGSLAMARTSDPNSATAQFYINVVDNVMLDYPGRDGHGYTVFGRVVEGMEVVDAIKAAPTANSGMFQNVPLTPIVIERAELIQSKVTK